ncbi:hypothetical protein [Streptomyces sp. NPDC017941]|uniref:hypothetical protein n=1 Tax=Streptomyces sp. NPDC017941 TaxID=3365018 RepID=UPI00378ACCA4
MAFIGHRCTCGHNDLNHTENDKGKNVCTANAGARCGRKCTALKEPELLPTFDIKGHPVERVIVPGDGLRTESGTAVTQTCTCDGCQALYDQITSA